MASNSERRKIFEAPPEVTFRGIKMFSTAISVQKHLQIAIKHP